MSFVSEVGPTSKLCASTVEIGLQKQTGKSHMGAM